jgi:hypothetical protein
VWSIKSTPDERRYSITGAPRIANGKVFIGSAGGEFDARGYIDSTMPRRKLLWRFWTIPDDPAKGFENKATGNGFRHMEDAGLVEGRRWRNGMGCHHLRSGHRPGDLRHRQWHTRGRGAPRCRRRRQPVHDSIVAVHAKDGSHAWHYQTTPWETWDYDTGQQLMLLDIEIDGKTPRGVAGLEERILLQPRRSHRPIAFSQAIHRCELGQRRGHEDDRPNVVPEARTNLTNQVFNSHQPGGRPRLAIHVLQSHTKLIYIPATTHWQLMGPFDARQKYLAEHPDAKTGFTGRLTAWDRWRCARCGAARNSSIPPVACR